jgi:hypothetical protein
VREYRCCIKEDPETKECLEFDICKDYPCVEWGERNVCTDWDEGTETIYNPPECSFVSSSGVRSNGVTIEVSIPPNSLKKFLDLSWLNTFLVDARSSIDDSRVTLSELNKWARDLVRDWNGRIVPQRHGYFILDSKQVGGAIYNQPDFITRSDGSFSSGCVATGETPESVIGRKDYIACQECRWTGSGWSCRWNNNDQGSYTIFDERWPATTDGRVNGNTPLNVEPGRIEFYTQPADVEPYLSVGESIVNHPTSTKTSLQKWIAGFPFKVNYGVNILGPGRFGNDKGNFWLELSGVLNFSGGTKPVSDSSTSNTLTFTPLKAGSLTITAKHNADDEKVSINENNEAIDNVESISKTITIYRYLCYQGFCWECPNEPQQSGVILKVKEAGCQAVEDAKCKAYINKSCKAGVRE